MDDAHELRVSRRQLLITAAAAMVSGMSGCALPSSKAAAAPVLAVREGRLRGTQAGGVRRFLGIPYAAPPLAGRRWLPPAPSASWPGERDASAFAAAPIQHVSWPNGYYPFEQDTSEDCLYLNVWAPQDADAEACPVYVWIHGGGNVAGTTQMPITDGSAYARAGIVFVSVEYRLGALGLLELGELLGPDYAGSGNLALLDLIAALRWVRDNIATFGGDPSRVTIGGQSAGAKNVATLLAMPAARGLFQRAVIESGGAQTVATLDQAQALARDFLRHAGLAPGEAHKLLQLDAASLLAAQMRLIKAAGEKYPFRAVVDGEQLPQIPVDAVAAGAARDIAVLAGTALDEVAFWGPPADGSLQVTVQDLANMALVPFAAHASQYVGLMPDADPQRRRYRSLTAEEYGIPTLRLAEAQAGAGGQLWLYRWDLAPLQGPHAGFAVHGSEMALVFGNLVDATAAVLGANDARAQQLAPAIFEAWCHFIRGAAPSSPALPPWPAYDLTRRPVLLVDAEPQLAFDPAAQERAIWSDWQV